MAIPSYIHSNPMIRWLMWERYRRIAQMAELDKSKCVIEFGCGIGVFLPTLTSLAGEVHAVDLVPQYARKLCRMLGLEATVTEDLSCIPERYADVIIAADVLEHVDDPAACVQELGSRLKSGGKLIVSGPTEGTIYKLGRIVAGFGGKGEYHHTDIGSLREVVQGCGFQLEASRSLPFWLPPHLFQILRFGLYLD